MWYWKTWSAVCPDLWLHAINGILFLLCIFSDRVDCHCDYNWTTEGKTMKVACKLMADIHINLYEIKFKQWCLEL